MKILNSLRKLWYDREDYIRLAGDDVLQRLKQQDVFQGMPPQSAVSINPSSGEYVIRNSLAEAIATGRKQWGHLDFYCAPIDSPPEPRYLLNRLNKYQIRR